MPRLLKSRTAVAAINVILLTALFLHLKYELWDKHASAIDIDTVHPSHLPDELLNEHETKADPVASDVPHLKSNSLSRAKRTAVVVASQASENATWLEEHFPEWDKYIYHVDDAKAPLTVPVNKGRESMVYLTYVFSIILNLSTIKH